MMSKNMKRMKGKELLLPYDKAVQLWSYDDIDGNLRWKVYRTDKKRVGSVAGMIHKETGYVQVKYDYRNYSGHRIAWVLMTGKWPEWEIDHINNVKHDNRFNNLRLATRSQNSRNMTGSIGISGVRGVSWNSRKQKWCVLIRTGSERKFIGYFSDPIEAEVARHEAEEEYHREFTFRQKIN